MDFKLLLKFFAWLLGAVRVAAPARRSVLIIEDIKNDADLIESIVRSQGYVPYICSTFNSALLKLKDRDWHRVLLDLNLGKPVMRDGVEIMEGTIFAEEAVAACPNIKIVFVTGHASSLLGNSTSSRYPCIVKGHDFGKLENAILAVLSSDEYASDLRMQRLFWFVALLCIASFLVGSLVERFKLMRLLGL